MKMTQKRYWDPVTCSYRWTVSLGGFFVDVAGWTPDGCEPLSVRLEKARAFLRQNVAVTPHAETTR